MSALRFIRTVEGDLPADEMGVILPHEHVVCDSSVWLNTDSARAHPEFSAAEPALENLWWMRQFPNSSASVLRLDSPDVAVPTRHWMRRRFCGMRAPT
jgi:hypothetical protein